MFRPNLPVVVHVSGTVNKFGVASIARKVPERGAVVRLNVSQQRTPVRADSSASRGAAQEEMADAVILLGPNTVAEINDLVVIAGVTLTITGKFPRHSVHGRLDHHEIQGTIRSLK